MGEVTQEMNVKVWGYWGHHLSIQIFYDFSETSYIVLFLVKWRVFKTVGPMHLLLYILPIQERIGTAPTSEHLICCLGSVAITAGTVVLLLPPPPFC
jgi:hypothetical protein